MIFFSFDGRIIIGIEYPQIYDIIGIYLLSGIDLRRNPRNPLDFSPFFSPAPFITVENQIAFVYRESVKYFFRVYTDFTGKYAEQLTVCQFFSVPFFFLGFSAASRS